MKKIKSIALFYNPGRENAVAYTAELEKCLSGSVCVRKICVNSGTKDGNGLIEPADVALAVGGDGTVLHVARRAVSPGIPVLGINAGSLGFLSCITQEDFLASLSDFLDGKFNLTERMLLAVSVRRSGKTVFGPMPALNDCIIRSSEPRAFGLKARRNGTLLTKYFGDGLIIAAPSGSTAYSLAAYGPIASPELSVLILTPICPHALTQRPLILPADKTVSVEMLGTKSGRQEFTVSVDGQENFRLEKGDIVEVGEYPDRLKLLVPDSYDYFAALRTKLRWGER